MNMDMKNGSHSIVSHCNYDIQCFGMHFRVAVGEYDPFLKLRTDEQGVLRMSGSLADVFNLLSDKLNITYTLYRSKGDSWGILGPDGWTGMLGMIAKNEVDLAIGPFTITYERWKSFDMSIPVYTDQVEILVPAFEWEMSLFNMFGVFDVEIWFLIFLTILALCFVYSFVEETEQRNYNFAFGIYANLWMFGRTLLHQGRVKCPRSCPKVLLVVFWMFGTLVLINVYSRVVLTNLLLRKSRKIDSIFDVIEDPNIFPVLEPQSSIFSRFQKETAEMYKAVSQKVNSNVEKCVLPYNQMGTTGMDQVLSGSFALITDAMRLRSFLTKRYKDKLPCRYRLAQEPLWNLRKAIAFRKSFPKQWIQQINQILRHTTESGWLDLRMRNEFFAYSECISSDDTEIESLGLKNTMGTFIILAIGHSVSLLVLIIEILSKKRRPIFYRFRPNVHYKRKLYNKKKFFQEH